jgi:hypothetical protein
MTELRYRIQVGNRYTYRASAYDLESLVRKLIDGDSLESLTAQIRGIKSVETRVKPEQISIALEIAPPKQDEQWRELPVPVPEKEQPKRPNLTPEARKEWRKQFNKVKKK